MTESTVVNLTNETTVHFADHEILLSFNSDGEAEAFYDWWYHEGKDRFAEYYPKWRDEEV